MKMNCMDSVNLMTCETQSERDNLESNTTPRFLIFCAGETSLPRIWIGKCENHCLRFCQGLVLIYL